MQSHTQLHIIYHINSLKLTNQWGLELFSLPLAHKYPEKHLFAFSIMLIKTLQSNFQLFFFLLGVFVFWVFSSVQSLSRVQLFATPWITAHQASLSITTPGVHPNSCPSSQWCHPAILSSVIRFSSCLQSFPISRSFPLIHFFASGGQSIGVSASALVLPLNIQDWSPLGWTGLISLQSKGTSRIVSNTTVQKHQFFSAQLSLWYNSHTSIHDHRKNHSLD